MRIGVLTGGGDCPGLNGVIRAAVTKGVKEYGYDFVGFRDGWKGPLEGLTMELNLETVRDILPKGGTILQPIVDFDRIHLFPPNHPLIPWNGKSNFQKLMVKY